MLIHTEACITARREYALKFQAYISKHPKYCTICNGWGFMRYTYDPSPSGVSLSPGTMTDQDPCPKCVDHGICPWCGMHTLNDEGTECKSCHWKYNEQEGGLPDQPECYCWEGIDVDDNEYLPIDKEDYFDGKDFPLDKQPEDDDDDHGVEGPTLGISTW